jgi:trk system potassium uptake protein TrkH
VHFRFVSLQLGFLLIVLSLSMGLTAGLAAYDGDGTLPAFGWSMLSGITVGLTLIAFGRWGSHQLGRREALLLVSLSWFVGALLAALPYWVWAHLDGGPAGAAFVSFANCYFEAMSGLTTTGATILPDISVIPRSLILWRAFTHWLGGLGIVVLFVAVLPLLGVGGKRLFRIETTGPTSQGATPRIAETARALWIIYVGLTIAQVAMMMLVDDEMTWFSAVTHTFATLATGGFSTMNSSAGGLPPATQWVIVLFMFLAGVNFAIYQQVMRGRFERLWRDTELRAYVMILLAASAVVALAIHGTTYHDTAGEAASRYGDRVVRDAVFQVVSVQTTTGFCTADFNEWHLAARSVLVLLMFVGGCGGSTGGGIKVIRIVVVAKVLWAQLEHAFRPQVVRPVRVGSSTVNEAARLGILGYVLGVVAIFLIGTAMFICTEAGNPQSMDGVTACTAVIASLNNIGPGLEQVGAVSNYNWVSAPGKLLLSILMAIGRLEVFAVLVIFMPRFWRSE